MKDYSIGKDEARTFILRYEIDGDNMIVYYARNKKDIIPYSAENERKVLGHMKAQVRSREDRFSKTKHNIKIYGVCFIVFIGGRFLIPGSDLIAFLVSCGISSVINWPIYKKYQDYQKNRLFLEEEITLNSSVKTNPNVLSNTKLDTKEFEVAMSSKNPVFDINTIDKVSYEDLKTMLENIKRSQDMEYVYFDSNEKDIDETGKTMVLK